MRSDTDAGATILRRSAVAGLIAVGLTISGCAATPATDGPARTGGTTSAPGPSPSAEQLDLTGDWSWREGPDPGQTMTATITADRIEVRWPSFEIGEEGEPLSGTMDRPLFWAGSFTPPQPGEETYTFTSVRDTAAMKSSLLASSESEKLFRFADGGLSFDVSVQGETQTITLERD